MYLEKANVGTRYKRDGNTKEMERSWIMMDIVWKKKVSQVLISKDLKLYEKKSVMGTEIYFMHICMQRQWN